MRGMSDHVQETCGVSTNNMTKGTKTSTRPSSANMCDHVKKTCGQVRKNANNPSHPIYNLCVIMEKRLSWMHIEKRDGNRDFATSGHNLNPKSEIL